MNDHQGRGHQPPVDGTGIVLCTIGGLLLWFGLWRLAILLDGWMP